ncbi:MAG: hypothetical protein RLP44_01600 [Aggregatilineales bacterium]
MLSLNKIGLLTASDLLTIAIKSTLRNFHLVEIKLPVAHDRGVRFTANDVLLLDDFALQASTMPSFIECNPDSKRVLLSHDPSPPFIQKTLTDGFQGYLYLGDTLADRLQQGIYDVMDGGRYLSPTASSALERLEYFSEVTRWQLTPYQQEVLKLMRDHWSTGQIAAHLNRKPNAIYQVQRLLRELFDAPTNSHLIHDLNELGL